ncbi:integrase core domain-containing protein, partial [Corynebacterium striatum]|uniref:integrase core domain-containing protein n=1 Tax=Corynebacterium striatum TaxID=43770 RepID=UPI003F824056
SYKNELIHTRRWDDVVEVEIATFEWVSWWNETRLHQSLGYRTDARRYLVPVGRYRVPTGADIGYRG